MGFYQLPSKPTPVNPDDVDLANAQHLHQALVKRLKVNHKFSRKTWSKEFATLARSLDGDRDRLTRVLTWYANNIGKEYVPEAFSAKSFRTKFLQIEKAYQRDERDNPKVEMTDQGRGIATALTTTYLWPKGSAAQVPVAVQLTLNSWWALWRKVRDYSERNPQTVKVRMSAEDYQKEKRKAKRQGYTAGKYLHRSADPHVRFAHHLKDVLSYSVPQLVQNHFRMVFHSVVEWPAWNGNLLTAKYTWRGDLDDATFTKVIADEAVRWGGSTKVWEKLKEELK